MITQWIEAKTTQTQRPVTRFVMVPLTLRTASPAEVDRSLRGHWRGACLLGDINALYLVCGHLTSLQTQLRGEMTWI